MKKRDEERKAKEEQQKLLEAELAKERERIRQLQREAQKTRDQMDFDRLDYEGEEEKSPVPNR